MRPSLYLTSPAYLVAWESERQMQVRDGSPGGDSYTGKEVWKKFSSAGIRPNSEERSSSSSSCASHSYSLKATVLTPCSPKKCNKINSAKCFTVPLHFFKTLESRYILLLGYVNRFFSRISLVRLFLGEQSFHRFNASSTLVVY